MYATPVAAHGPALALREQQAPLPHQARARPAHQDHQAHARPAHHDHQQAHARPAHQDHQAHLAPLGTPRGWALQWAWQWRALLTLMSVLGLNCAGGWPPRRSRALLWYGVLTTLFRTWCVCTAIWELAWHAGERYDAMLCVYEMTIKGVAATIMQAVLLLRGDHLCRFTECLLLYARVGAPSGDWGAVAAVGPACYVVLLFMMAVTARVAMRYGIVIVLPYVLGDFAPSMIILFFEIVQLLLLSIFVGFAIDEGRHVREWLSAMGEQSPGRWLAKSLDNTGKTKSLDKSVDKSPLLLGLRALRGRQQVLHDMVVQNNMVFGWCFLCGLLHVFIESVLSLYLGIAHIRLRLGNVSQESDHLEEEPGLTLWGFYEIFLFTLTCILGQRLSDQHSRIYWDLQGFLVTNPQLGSEAILVELHSFTQQIQMQDNRPGIFNLLFFDASLLNAGFAIVLTYIIVLHQFEPEV